MQHRNQSPTINYITRTFVCEPAYIAASRAEGELRRPGMQVSSFEGHLLQWLVRISGATNILEIGTFMATSTMWMAGGLPAGGHITSLEFDASHAAAATNHVAASPHESIIKIIHTNAHEWIATAPEKPHFDLVFIDAEKTGYMKYLDAILPRLTPCGWIIGDNSLLFGALAGEGGDQVSAAAKTSMERFNETLADSTKFESILLPTAEGLTVARRR
ncbi:MAG: O-methyltransferase [Rickettsiales bacterium]